MARDTKTNASIRLPKEIWELLDEIGKKELWTRPMVIQEIAKFYAAEKGIKMTGEEEKQA